MDGERVGPVVSVVIPCFNLGEYLDQAVGSVLGQTFGEYEIIVVDPGSTDEATRRLLADYRRPKTTVLVTERKRAGAARNYGISRARGTYICCLDADDLLEPECLEKASRVLRGNPGAGFVTFWYTIFGAMRGEVKPESVSLADFLVDNPACTTSVFRREAWERAGGYDEELEGYEDWDFWLAILEQRYRACLIKEFLFRYRDREGGKHRVSDTGACRDAIMRRIIGRHAASFREHATEVIFERDRLLGLYRLYWRDAVGEAERLGKHHAEAHRYIDALEEKCARGAREIGAIRAEIEALRRALEQGENELRALRASKAWKIGCAFRDARRSARDLLALPVRVARSLRGKGG